MWNEEIFLRWFIHSFASALAVLAFIGAIAMWTYDPAVPLVDVFAGLRP